MVLDQREHKPTKVHASPGQRDLQGILTFQLALKSESVWPAAKTLTGLPVVSVNSVAASHIA